MYFLKEHRLCNQFADAFAKARRKAWLEFAKANPNLPDAEISAQFSSSYSSPESILAAIAKYRTTGLDKDAAEAKKAAKVAYETLKASPETMSEFEKYGRSVGTAIGEGVLDEGTTLNRDKLLKAFGQLSGGESAGFRLASTGYAAPSAGNIAEGVKPFDYANAFREDLNPQPRFGATSTPLSEAERQRRIQTGTIGNDGTDISNPMPQSQTPQQQDEYNRVYGKTQSPMEVQNPLGINYDNGRQRLPSDMGTPQGKTGAVTGGMARTGGMRGIASYGQPQQQPTAAQNTAAGVQRRLLERTKNLNDVPAVPLPTLSDGGNGLPPAVPLPVLSDGKNNVPAVPLPVLSDKNGASEQPVVPTDPAKAVDGSAMNAALAQISAALGIPNIGQAASEGLSIWDQIEQSNAQIAALGIEGAQSQYEQTNEKLNEWANRFSASSKQAETVLMQAKEQTDKLLAEQQSNQMAQLQWQENKLVRDQQKAMRKDIDTREAMLALSGGYGSSNGNESIIEAESDWEQSIADLQKEFGFKRTDLSLLYTEKFNKSIQDYKIGMLNNINDLNDKLLTLEQQDFTSQQARDTAQREAVQGWLSANSSTKLEHAKQIAADAKAMRDEAAAAQTAKLNEEKAAWDTLKWAATTYGSTTPQALKDSLKTKLQGVDVDSLLSNATLAEAKAKKATGGSGGGFSWTDKNSLNEPPTFEAYLDKKEQEAGVSFDEKARAGIRKEYDAMISNEKKGDTMAIKMLAEDKVINMAKWASEQALETVDRYLKNGDVESARAYVDGLGDSPGATERKDFIQALVVKQSMAELDYLLDDLGTTGPVIGRIRSMNPYDNRVVRMQQLITQVIPSLARGIYKEVGVLTDTDIATYRSTMANPNLTYEQAKQATLDTIRKVDLSLGSQIDVWSAAKMNVREFRSLAEREPEIDINAMTPYSSSALDVEGAATESVTDYVNSLIPR